jgi:hypothetical protein
MTPDRPERETLEATILWAAREFGSVARSEKMPYTVSEAAYAEQRMLAALAAAAPDARLAEALAEAKMLMGNEHVSWQGTAARLFEIIERLAAAREGTRSGGDAT